MRPFLVKGSLPDTLKHGSIVSAIVSNFDQMDWVPGVSREGFIQQTLLSIANATFLKVGGDFWLIENADGTCGGYMLARFVVDIDNKLCYWISQVYVAKEHRGKGSKEAFQVIREYAKKNLASHIVAVSGRENSKAYCRFLGEGYHKYATLLKEDL